MKSLDRQSLEEQTRLVSRYVAGDLSRSERAEFEAWLVASAELASEVEMERRLRRGIASAARRGWLRRPAPERARFNHGYRLAIAASLLASLAVGWSLLLPSEDHSRIAESRPAAAKAPRTGSQVARLASVRGGADAPHLTLSLATAPAELVLEPEVVVLMCDDGSMSFECLNGTPPTKPQYPEYDLIVQDARNATVWSSLPQIPLNGTQLSFAWGGSWTLVPGDYTIVVRGQAPDGADPVGKYTLRITQ
jgi:hypothetical protein